MGSEKEREERKKAVEKYIACVKCIEAKSTIFGFMLSMGQSPRQQDESAKFGIMTAACSLMMDHISWEQFFDEVTTFISLHNEMQGEQS